MLPVPILDDQLFQDIVAEARKMIPRIYPDWTDENYHDPGITMIELLAWLSEMQQYYLDQITAKNERKFLKLMGIKPLDAICATACVSFFGVEQARWIPSGTRLAAGDQVFECNKSLYILPVIIEKLLVLADGEYSDATSFNQTPGLSYYAFGRLARPENRFLLGMNQALPGGRELSLTIRMDEDYPILPGQVYDGCQIISSARTAWYYYGREGASPGWYRLQVVSDDSFGLHRSGNIRFIIPGEMVATRFNPAADTDRYWISCVLEEEGYELSPRIDDICLNTLSVTQQHSQSCVHHFSATGEAGQSLYLSHALAYYGINEVQIRAENGDWYFCRQVDILSLVGSNEQVFTLQSDVETRGVTLTFGDGEHGMIPVAGQNNIRLLSYQHGFEKHRWLGRSNGLPGQSFEIPWPDLIKGSFKLQIGVKTGISNQWQWQDWLAVDDFTTSGSADRHYVLDRDHSLIYFGNNEHGIIPPAAEIPNILIIVCQLGGGDRGNVKPGEINRVLEPEPALAQVEVTNLWPAEGGAPEENLATARARSRKARNTPQRAVTAADFEALARSTPGHRVARVKALPLYSPGMKGYPVNQAPAVVTVVVVPFSESPYPMPSEGFLKSVQCHLNRYRLLTTELQVIPPDYIKVSVYAVVVVVPGASQPREKITRVLDHFLQALDVNNPEEGWAFGRTVNKGDIFEIINQVPVVEYVKDLWLYAEGGGIRREVSGDIELPPGGLVYSGEHEIEIIHKNDL